MAIVKILVEGTHKTNDAGILDIWCTTTLIKSDINIVVDPGAIINKERLVDALKSEGLTPEDIDIVVLTHTHIDHTINSSLFSRAKVFLRFIGGTDFPGMFQILGEGTLTRYDILNEPIAKDVKIIETQGHAIDGITVLVETKEGVVAIAGDAISSEEWANPEKKPDPNVYYDVEKFDISRQKILEAADWIIPGHGKMFKINK